MAPGDAHLLADDRLAALLGAVLRVDGPGPSPERVARLRAEVDGTASGLDVHHDARPPDPPAPSPATDLTVGRERRAARENAARAGSSRSRALVGVVAAGAVVAAAAGGVLVGRELRPDQGRLEFTVALTGPDDADGEVTGQFLATGRSVELSTRTLPVLPTGQYYEVWFLTEDAEGRISAGTFHPDAEGVSEVVLFAAVDPVQYPRLEITAEPGDGDPAPSDDVVLAGEVDLADGP